MIYLDNAATTYPKPEQVYVFMDQFYREFGVNIGRGQYKLADRASSLVKDTRQLLLNLFNCPEKQVVFTPTATEALNIILQGLDWQDGLTIYISPFEHNAVLRVTHHLQTLYKINVIELQIDMESMAYDIEGIKYQFQHTKPDVVVISHASNVCGLVAPIKEICTLSKTYDAVNVIDMAQTAGLIPTDLGKIQADYVVFAGHKTLYAPYGAAGFILDKNAPLKPLLYGGTGVESANLNLPSTIPERLEVGSLNIQAIAGFHAALSWLQSIGVSVIHEQELLNRERLLGVLSQFANVHIVGFSLGAEYVGIVSCIFDGYSSDSIGQVLSRQGIAVRTGLHCAPNAHRFLGTFPDGTVRFSVSYFNNPDDFVQLHSALTYIEENS